MTSLPSYDQIREDDGSLFGFKMLCPKRNESFKFRYSVKENIDVVGLKNEFGSAPDSNAKIVQILSSLGGECVGNTRMCTLGLTAFQERTIQRKAQNLYLSDRIVLGSSWGAALSVISNAVDIAVGTDSGGSIRAPAASTGLLGLLCSSDLIPSQGIRSYGFYDRPGFLARNPKSLRSVVEKIPGTKASNPSAWEFIIPKSIELQIPEIFRNEWLRVTNLLPNLSEQDDAEILIGLEKSLQLRKALLSKDAMEVIHQYERDHELPSELLALIEYGRRLTDVEYQGALLEVKALDASISPILRDRILIIPTLAEPIPSSDNSEEIRNFLNSQWNRFLLLPNLLGLPSLSIPLRGEFSLQLVGSRNSELSLTDCAEQIITLCNN